MRAFTRAFLPCWRSPFFYLDEAALPLGTRAMLALDYLTEYLNSARESS
jgi:hypothetical protein